MLSSTHHIRLQKLVSHLSPNKTTKENYDFDRDVYVVCSIFDIQMYARIDIIYIFTDTSHGRHWKGKNLNQVNG